MSEVRLEARGLHKSFGATQAVGGGDVGLGAAEIVGLLGPNAAGKTTIFDWIAGRTQPSAGEVLLGGKSIARLPMYRRAREGITYLPQETTVFRRLTVADNIMAILETVERKRSARRARLVDLLAELGLDDKADQRADTLSGGERRRLEITRALVLEPKFMLLDEPFAGVDPIAVLEIQKIVGHLRDRGIGVMITDHNVRETLSICDRAYIIKDGLILMQGTPREIADDPRVREVYLGENFELGDP